MATPTPSSVPVVDVHVVDNGDGRYKAVVEIPTVVIHTELDRVLADVVSAANNAFGVGMYKLSVVADELKSTPPSQNESQLQG